MEISLSNGHPGFRRQSARVTVSRKSCQFQPGRSQLPQRFPRRVEAALARTLAAGPLAVQVLLVVLSLAAFLPGFTGLPPVDRDEPRFAQASRQMLASGDFIDIRFQDGTRYKKPAGIYWLQSAAVALTGRTEGSAQIWRYRLPSLAAAVLSVLLTARIAALFAGAAGGLAAGLLMAGMVLLGAEARLATTDAVLLATVLAAQSVLARLYGRARDTGFHDRTPLPLAQRALFWGAMALSLLIKGPVGPMIVALTAAALAVAHRRASWLAALRPLSGLVFLMVLVLPWYVAITLKAGHAFWDEALGRDLMAKIGKGQEGHGAPPGTYLGLLWLTFLPASLALALALPGVWAARRSPGIAFAMAWALPGWLVFEAASTKLVHYVLPLYPALAIAVALVWAAAVRATIGPWRRLAIGALCALPFALLAVVGGYAASHGSLPAPALFLGAAIAGAGLWLFARALAGHLPLAALFGLWAVGLGLGTGLFPGLAAIAALWPAPALLALAPPTPACPAHPIVALGYEEPSLVVLSPAPVRFAGAPTAVGALRADPCTVVIVDRAQTATLAAAADQAGLALGAHGQVTALNIGTGQTQTLTVFGAAP